MLAARAFKAGLRDRRLYAHFAAVALMFPPKQLAVARADGGGGLSHAVGVLMHTYSALAYRDWRFYRGVSYVSLIRWLCGPVWVCGWVGVWLLYNMHDACLRTACMHSSIRARIGIGKAMAVMTPGSLSLADTATVINPKP